MHSIIKTVDTSFCVFRKSVPTVQYMEHFLAISMKLENDTVINAYVETLVM